MAAKINLQVQYYFWKVTQNPKQMQIDGLQEH